MMRISLLQQSEYGIIRMKHFRIKPGSVQFRFSSAKERLAELFALRLQDAILLRGIPKLPMFVGRNIWYHFVSLFRPYGIKGTFYYRKSSKKYTVFEPWQSMKK